MASLKVDVRTEFDKELIATLEQLPYRLWSRAERGAVAKACNYVAKQAKKNLRSGRGVQSGLLRDSIGVKTKSNQATWRILGIVGAKRGTVSKRIKIPFFKTRITVRNFTKQRARWNAKHPGMENAMPTRYAHLVDKGHAKGRGHGAARPHPFLSSAVQDSAAAIDGIFQRSLQQSLSEAAAR